MLMIYWIKDVDKEKEGEHEWPAKSCEKKQGKPKKMRTKAKEKGAETRSSGITTNICC